MIMRDVSLSSIFIPATSPLSILFLRLFLLLWSCFLLFYWSCFLLFYWSFFFGLLFNLFILLLLNLHGLFFFYLSSWFFGNHFSCWLLHFLWSLFRFLLSL